MHFLRLVLAIFVLTNAFAEIIEVPEDAASIQEAFALSQTGDTILLANGSYQETVRVPVGSRTLAGNYIFSGDSVDRETTVLMPADTIQADTACILLLMQPCSLTIVGLTFENGRGVRRSNDRREGGAIYAVGSNVSIQNCLFRECFADFGICIWTNQLSELNILNTSFTENGRVDGGYYSQACIRATDTRLTIYGCRFHHNTVSSAPAIIVTSGSVLIENSLIDSNIIVDSIIPAIAADDAEMTVRRTIIAYNINQLGDGVTALMSDSEPALIESCSFIANEGGRTVSLQGDTSAVLDCLFERNSAPLNASAGLGFGNGSYLVERCSFRDNTADGWTVLTTNGSVHMNECEFSGNSSLFDSGAVLQASLDSLFLTNCSFENNSPYAFATDFWWFEGYIDARNCYWGAPSGPYQEILNPDGGGDAILGTDVLFDPWLTESPLETVRPQPLPPLEFRIAKAFPNPFNSSVTIEYALSREQDVRLEVYDILGRKVEMLLHERQGIGVHSVLWKADGFASGLYFARLSSREGVAQTVKLMLLK